MLNPDVNGHNVWWGTAVNPMAGKVVESRNRRQSHRPGEMAIVHVSENGHRVLSYVGPTDKYPGTQRTLGIGGYARMQGYTSNWRYFDDAYLDTTLSRVVLADKPVLSKPRSSRIKSRARGVTAQSPLPLTSDSSLRARPHTCLWSTDRAHPAQPVSR